MIKTSFQGEWDEAAKAAPVSDEWIEGLLAHKDEGPIGEPAARDLLREVMRFRATRFKLENVVFRVVEGNAAVHTFRTTGKWYQTGRGNVSREVFSGGFTKMSRRQQILRENDDKCPGLSTRGDHLVWVVLLDEGVDYGFPLMLPPGGS